MSEVTQEVIDCWRENYGLDKDPHVLHAFWGDRVPGGAVLALKAACDELEALRQDAERYRWLTANYAPEMLTHFRGDNDTPYVAAFEVIDAAIDVAMLSALAVQSD